jgi:hypothetical protein
MTMAFNSLLRDQRTALKKPSHGSSSLGIAPFNSLLRDQRRTSLTALRITSIYFSPFNSLLRDQMAPPRNKVDAMKAMLSILSCEIRNSAVYDKIMADRTLLSILSCEIRNAEVASIRHQRSPFNSLLRDQVRYSHR